MNSLYSRPLQIRHIMDLVDNLLKDLTVQDDKKVGAADPIGVTGRIDDNLSEAYKIYRNILVMFKYRNITLTSPVLEESRLVAKLNEYDYIQIDGFRKGDPLRKDAKVIVFYVKKNSVYSKRTAEFSKMIKPALNPTEFTEVIVISDNEPAKDKAPSTDLSKFILKQIADLTSASKKMILFENHNYERFTIVIPESIYVVPHTIVPDKEGREWCEKHYTVMENFPKILSTDAVAVWLGVRPGHFVKIERLSETAGTAEAFRYCPR